MPATPPATETARRICNYIEAELARRGESKAALGRVIGVSAWSLNRRFNQEYPFQTYEIEAIAAHWGVTVQDIFDGSSQAREEGDK